MHFRRGHPTSSASPSSPSTPTHPLRRQVNTHNWDHNILDLRDRETHDALDAKKPRWRRVRLNLSCIHWRRATRWEDISGFWFTRHWPMTSFSTWGATTKPQSQCKTNHVGGQDFGASMVRQSGGQDIWASMVRQSVKRWKMRMPSWHMLTLIISWLMYSQSQPRQQWMTGSTRSRAWSPKMDERD